jgi:hypothetical protein
MNKVAAAAVGIFCSVSLAAFAGDEKTETTIDVVGSPKVPPRASVALTEVPQRAADVDPDHRRFLEGEGEKGRPEYPVSEEEFRQMVVESLRQGVDSTVQVYQPGRSGEDLAPVTDQSFRSINYSESQQGTPPDPDIMVGSNHIVVGVNTSFQVFDKSGASVVGPTLYSDLWGSNCGTGAGMNFFDPYSAYDEAEDRYLLGITAYDPSVNGGDNGYACIAVSQTGDPTGQWWLYSFDANPGTGTEYFFDFPHIGVGQSALYVVGNMFGNFFVGNNLMVLDKTQMYAGGATPSWMITVPSTQFTVQPAKLKGYSTGGWPSNPAEPHFFLSAEWGNNANQLTLSSVTLDAANPWSVAPTYTVIGDVTVNTFSQPVSQPQLGGGNIEGNDYRLLDVEYWAGSLWATHSVGCNPGTGTVNCVRWYEIDASGPSLVQQGTFATDGVYRSFPDLAVDQCGDMVVGYSMTSASIYPSVYMAGREVADPAGQLKAETEVRAGDVVYQCYDSTPRRWGDYSGAALDPNGVTMWYVGEYSTPSTFCRWGTWVHGVRWTSCSDAGSQIFADGFETGDVSGWSSSL